MTYNPILPKTELENLAAECPENTVELFTPNDFYGHASVLKQYCGLDQSFPLPGIYPHGPTWGDKVWDKEISHPLPFLFMISKHQLEIYSKHCKKSSWVIGSPFYYAHRIIESELKCIEKEATGTVVFPAHSTHHLTSDYDINGFIEFLKQLPKENNPITICLGWRDIQLGSHIQYLNEGFNCTTAGHMYDKQFFFRLLKIIAFHKYAVTNNRGTSSFYCAAMSLPIVLYEQNIRIQEATQNQPSYLAEEASPAPYLPIVESFYNACILPSKNMLFKQREIAKSVLGYDSILEPEEMKNLFESLWQRKKMQIFIKKPDYLLEGSLNDILQTLSKNLTKYPRKTPGKLKIDGKSFAYTDLHSFYHQAIQIFGSELYGFAPDTDNPVILDCGAHIGLASLYFATKYPNAKIYVYEADPAIAKMLIDNVNSFGLRQVAVYSQAVWVHNDGVFFNKSGDDSGHIDNIHQDGKSKVSSVRLRDLLGNNSVDLLKLDIEGAEYDVIEDCDGTLANVKKIIVEVHKFREDSGSLGRLLNILERNNFEYTLGDLHSADWIESSDNPPFSACKTKNYIITVFAWQKASGKRVSMTKSKEDIVQQAVEKLNFGKNQEAISLLSQAIKETPSDNPIKVVHLCMQDFGGAGKAACRLHKGLQAIGVDSTMLVLNKRSGDPSVKVLPDDYSRGMTNCLNVSVYNSAVWNQQARRWQKLMSEYPKRPTGLEMFTDATSDIRLDLIQEIREADVINLHWVAGLMDYPRASFALQGKTIVWTLHDMNSFTGGCHYAGDCKKYIKGCGACLQLGSETENDLSHHVWKQKYDAYKSLNINIVTPSRWLGKCASESKLFFQFPVKVVPYGFPIDIFRPYPKIEVRKALNIPESAKVILFGADSVVNERKGFKYLLEALNKLSLKNEHNNIILTFGHLPQGVKITSKYPVINLGPIADENQLAMIYSAADVFVLPSLEDNLPNTIIEAMSCGVPVVSFDIGGIPDMIEHKKTGYLVKPKDIAGLIEGIEWAISSTDNGSNFLKRCREKAEKEYALDVQAKAYKDLYSRVLKGHSSWIKDIQTKSIELNQQGEALFIKGDIDGALIAFTKAIEINLNYATAHNNLGVLYWQTGEAQKAVEHFAKALEIDPNDRDTILNCGEVFKSLEKTEDARNIYASYLQKNPNDEEVTRALADLQDRRVIEMNEEDKKYLVSAIVSTYNSERFIRGCLEDLEAQTIADKLEIIVVNSGSQQNEEAIVKEFQQRYKNIKYVKTKKRETVYQAWNRGIKAASGEYITNANTDDRHREDAFERMAEMLDARPDVALVYANVIVTKHENETFDKCTPAGSYRWLDWNRRYLLEGRCFMGPQPMWRRSSHDEYGYFDDTLVTSGDYEFWLRLSQTNNFHHISDFLGLYLRSPNSIENSNREIQKTENEKILRMYRKADVSGDIIRRFYSDNDEELIRIHNQRGEELFNAGKFKSAKTIFEQILSKNPNLIEPLNNLGVIAFQEGNMNQAVSCFTRALETDPNYFEAIENLGRCAEAQKEYLKAAEWFEQALKLKPDEVGLLNAMGNCFIQTEDFASAREIYKKSLGLDGGQESIKTILRELERMIG